MLIFNHKGAQQDLEILIGFNVVVHVISCLLLKQMYIASAVQFGASLSGILVEKAAPYPT